MKDRLRVIDAAPDRALSIVSFMDLLQGARSKLEARQLHQSLRQLQFPILTLPEPIGAIAAALIEQHALANGIQLADRADRRHRNRIWPHAWRFVPDPP
jgi:predicted nucleic acid-binding protein